MAETMNYKLEAFEGPLDLLLSLIEKNKVQITDIPIALIFEQYMEQLDLMQKMDMEVAGEFIVMASELMLIKSKMLLPKAETETEDPREKLAAMLAEYQRMKQAAGYLSGQFEQFSGRMVKDSDEVKPDSGKLEAHDAAILQRVMLSMLRQMDKTDIERANRERSEQPFERILRAPIV
ncbi:MAG: segregation/condensation protein A, partial [Ruminococcaceae bacterium]|nr:segregation/condensation protein A [Oscillospiraceae bacterium]